MGAVMIFLPIGDEVAGEGLQSVIAKNVTAPLAVSRLHRVWLLFSENVFPAFVV